MKTKLHFVLSFSMFFVVFCGLAQESYWQETTHDTSRILSRVNNLDKSGYKFYELNIENFKNELLRAPLRSASRSTSISVTFPNEEFGLEAFRIIEAPVLSATLSQQFPNIKTYIGYSIKNPGVRARFSVTPQGLQAMISYPDKPTTFIVPVAKNNSNYIVYNRGSRLSSTKDFECFTEDEVLPLANPNMARRGANDQTLKTFRIAISTNGEYTEFWDDGDNTNGSAKEDALAQVVSTLHRSNEVFEVDMAVNFTLVTGTETIYDNPVTDPYSVIAGNSIFNVSTELQNTLSALVGEQNYDIGHLLGFGDKNGTGGCIGCVCVDNQKGGGVSSHDFLDNDGGVFMSDFFDIDYVPHEIGHQMGANHTWSFASEGEGVNVEPGSGTTIMGYAGITDENDVQDHTDAYFHYESINQILNNLESRTCWTATTISNNPPIADAGPNMTIPIGTAFVLKGSGSDSDNSDTLFYNWEQIDDGVTTFSNFGPNKSTGPVWRSRPPSSSPNRFMPILERVIAGELTETNPVETIDNSSWETVSNVSRTLNFALTVRDRSETVGVGQFPQSDSDTMTVTVDDSAGPFVVTSQNESVTWIVGTEEVISWDVANTNTGAVNTPTVNILLSIDGGITYPFNLANNVSNNGSATITVPNIGGSTTTARVKVEGNNNIFYAINNRDFTIEELEFVISPEEFSYSVCSPNSLTIDFTYNTFLGFSGVTNFSVVNLPAGASASFSPTSATADGTNVVLTLTGITNLVVGNYPIEIRGVSGSLSQSTAVEFNVYDTNFSKIDLLAPADGSIDELADEVNFLWETDINAEAYELDIATDPSFSNIVLSTVVENSNYTASGLNALTLYYWRVRSINDCGNGSYSDASFITLGIDCSSVSNQTSVAIPDNRPSGVDSDIVINDSFNVFSVKVSVNITHTFVDDLILELTSPEGTTVVLSSRNGGDGDNYVNTMFDDEAENLISEGSAPFNGDFVPDESLALFNGEDASGTWTLNVSDNAFIDTGILQNWSLELCSSETLSINTIEKIADFRIYPNPNDGEFNIAMDNLQNNKVGVEIYDLNGRIVYKQIFQSGVSFKQTIKSNILQSGLYLIKLNDGLNESIQKLIIN